MRPIRIRCFLGKADILHFFQFKVCLFLVVTHLLHAGNLRQYLEAAEDGKLGPQTSSD